jgi:hypothetical protein
VALRRGGPGLTAAGGRRRVWRWALAVWTVSVIVGGALTLWLQDSAEPQRPGGWEKDEDGPAPLLSFTGPPPSCPTAGDGTAVLCVYATAR